MFANPSGTAHRETDAEWYFDYVESWFMYENWDDSASYPISSVYERKEVGAPNHSGSPTGWAPFGGPGPGFTMTISGGRTATFTATHLSVGDPACKWFEAAPGQFSGPAMFCPINGPGTFSTNTHTFPSSLTRSRFVHYDPETKRYRHWTAHYPLVSSGVNPPSPGDINTYGAYFTYRWDGIRNYTD